MGILYRHNGVHVPANLNIHHPGYFSRMTLDYYQEMLMIQLPSLEIVYISQISSPESNQYFLLPVVNMGGQCPLLDSVKGQILARCVNFRNSPIQCLERTYKYRSTGP